MYEDEDEDVAAHTTRGLNISQKEANGSPEKQYAYLAGFFKARYEIVAHRLNAANAELRKRRKAYAPSHN